MGQHLVWIVPASFCAMLYVSDWRYLPEDKVPESRKLQKEWKNKDGFYGIKSPSSVTTSRSYKLLSIRALRNLKYGEEQFVDYGSTYEVN